MAAARVLSAADVLPAARGPRRPAGLIGFFAWVAAWMASALIGALVVDWSFVPFVPPVLVAVQALVWFGLGVNVIVQVVRCSRGAPILRRVLLIAAIPLCGLMQPLLLASAIGPPSDICLSTEFHQHRAAFAGLASAFRDELAASQALEADAFAAGARADADAIAERLVPLLRLVELRRSGPCFELVRWCHVSSASGFEVGFLFSERHPEDIPVPIDRATFLRGGVRSYRHLEGNWFLFRAAW